MNLLGILLITLAAWLAVSTVGAVVAGRCIAFGQRRAAPVVVASEPVAVERVAA